MIQLDEKKKLSLTQQISDVILQELPVFQKRWDAHNLGLDFLRSIQYTPEQIAYYDLQKRPTNVFNIVTEKINHLLGDQLLNDQPQRVLAKAGGTQQVALVHEKILDHWHSPDQNDYKRVIGEVALHGWVQGSCLFPRWSNEREIDGSIVYGMEPMDNIMWDTRARHYFLDDAKYMLRFRWMAPDDIANEKKWKHVKDEINKLLNDTTYASQVWGGTEWQARNAQSASFVNQKDGKYLVVEYYTMEWESVEVAYNPQTKTADILAIEDEARKQAYIDGHPELVIVESTERVKYRTTVIPGLNIFVGKEKCDTQDRKYDLIVYHPYNYANYVHQYFGLMTLLMGPQKHLNDIQNRTLDAMNKSVNPGLELVPDAYENPEALQYAGQAGFKLFKKKNFANIQTFRQFEGPQFNTAFAQATKDALFFIESLTTSENALGRSETSNEPAMLFQSRVLQSQIRFAVPNFWLNSTKCRLNNKIIRQTQANLPAERLFLITDRQTGEQQQIYVNVPWGQQILNDIRTGEYQVSVDDQQKTPMAQFLRNQTRERFAAFLQQTFGPNAYRVIDWKGLFENSDLGEMEDQLKLIEDFIGKLAAQEDQNVALVKTNAFLDTVRKNVDLNAQETPDAASGAVMPASRQPARS